ncbi:MAG: BamA/TamA family outer membrane protein [candidate division Zixibacteria bacterium]|nr:BamA/TamA family outer membrane protein [candidate division Zixibacteria bacterium]
MNRAKRNMVAFQNKVNALSWLKHFLYQGQKEDSSRVLKRLEASSEKVSYAGLGAPPTWGNPSLSGRVTISVRKNVAVFQKLLKYFLTILFTCLLSFLGLPSSAEEGFNKLNGVWISDNIKIEGNQFFDTEKLLSEIKLKKGFSYNTDLLERGIDNILTLYEENGFPYCQISPSHFKISQKGRLAFSFLVDEGPRVKIREVQLEGLKTTQKKVILRELGTDILGFFSQSSLNTSLKRLKRLSYIKDVEEVELLAGVNPEEGILKITLVERRNNTFSGILGYAPAEGNRKGNLFGSLDLVFDNIFGTGRKIEWSWSRKDPYSSRFFFLYREPWVLGFPPSLELKATQLDYDSTYLQLSFSAKLLFNSTNRVSWGVDGGWEKVVPGSEGKTYLPDSRKYRMGITFSVDLLDQPDNPRKGLLYQTEISYAQKRNFPTSFFAPERQKVSLIKFSLDLKHFLPTLKRQTFFVGLHLKGLNTNEDQVPISDQFKLGGINSIRGYREEEFFGTQIAWANLEYRFLLDRNSRLFFFGDYGYFERKALSGTDKAPKKISGKKLGYGFGLRIDSKAGLLGIDYGLGEGDSFSQGKIHFGVTNRF